MNRAIEAKRTVGLVALVVATLMVLTAALAASDAEAKKKKKKKKRPPAPALVVVQCAQQGTICTGTPGNDLLIGTGEFERINGGEGNDIYDGRNGEDVWFDESAASNDSYQVGSAFQASAAGAGNKFEPFDVLDNGGSDTVDLRPFNSDDIEVSEPFDGQLGIRVAINEDRTGFVSILGHLENEQNRVESFRFSDRTLSAEEIEDLGLRPARS